MWKFSIICSFMAIFTGIALNLISNSIHDKRKQLSELEKRIEQKEIKMRPNIDKGDIDVKLKKIFGFLEKRANVKISVVFRGRELGNTSFGKSLLDSIIKETEDIASVLVEPKFENRTYSALLAPKKIK